MPPETAQPQSTTSRGRPMLLRFAARLLATLFVAWVALTGIATWLTTHRLDSIHPEPAPDVHWATVETNRIKTSDGLELGSWLFRATHGAQAQSSSSTSKGAVLILHGINNSRSGMIPICHRLVDDGYTVLALTQRAHGDSTGKSIDIGWSSQFDVVAAVDFLEHKFPGQPVYVLGKSMGSASAIFAAKTLGTRVSGYLLEEPYKDLESALRNRLRHALPRGLDTIAYYGMWLWSPVSLPVSPEEISPYKHIGEIPDEVPVVLLAGSMDGNAHADEVKDMYERIKEHARFILFVGAGHEDLDRRDGELYETAIKAAFGGQENGKQKMKTEK